MSASLSRCVRCGSTDLDDREIEELVRAGDDVAALRVLATVCHRCGEQYFSQGVIERIEEVRRKLDAGDVDGFRVLGRVLAG